MKNLKLNIKLTIVLGIFLIGSIIIYVQNLNPQKFAYSESMENAVSLTQKWFNIVREEKQKRNILSDAHSLVENNFLIGDDWSDITTTLGSLESKETSTNPDFAALVVRLLNEAKIKKGDAVGIVLSGSFPALSIAVLAAIQTMELDAIIMSSLGASTYGANQAEATWIDIEKWLRLYGDLQYSSTIISLGAGQDNGNGLTEEGKALLKTAAVRNHIDLYIPSDIEESIEYKTQIFQDNNISILINIGGNMASLGACSHSLNIPNGLQFSTNTCSDNDRGIIVKLNENGIPFIQFLNIKELAARYGIEVSPGIHYSKSTNLYSETKSNKYLTAFFLFIGSLSLYILLRNHFLINSENHS